MLRQIISAVKQVWATARSVRVKRKERMMRLCETLPLGERRYLAVVAVEGQKFLLAAAGNSISLLTRLSSDGRDALAGVEPDGLYDPEESKTWR